MIHSIILARGGSKGIKNKNLIKIKKKPLLYWSIEKSIKSKSIHKTWVSSDDLKILNYSKKLGAKIIKRPKSISGDNATSEAAWFHAIQTITKSDPITLIVGIQPTSPIRDVNDFDEAIKKFSLKGYDSLFSANNIHDFNTWSINKKLIPNYNYRNRKRRQDIENLILENGSFYLFKPQGFIKAKNRLFGKIGYYLLSKEKSFQIDDYIDIKIIECLM